MLTLDVHCLTVIRDLAAMKIESADDFEWQSQLRYYWEENNLNVCIMDVTMTYGNEYLGNSGRLVITPLTDRCYRTLMGALHLQYGGAPEGTLSVGVVVGGGWWWLRVVGGGCTTLTTLITASEYDTRHVRII